MGGFRQCCSLGRVEQASVAEAWMAPESEEPHADELLGQ